MTVCQIRTATEALLDALPLCRTNRDQRLERAAELIQQTQKANVAATRSHTKARRRALRAIGIRVERLTSCLPP